MRGLAALLALFCLVAILLAYNAVSLSAAQAGSASPGWMVSSVAEPSNFSSADNPKCSATGRFDCDSYFVTVTNVGSEATKESVPISIVDRLPPGLKPVGMHGRNLENEQPLGCDKLTTTCGYGGTVASGGTLTVDLEVEVLSESEETGPVTNVVRVEGGGASTVTTSAPLTMPNTVGRQSPGFGVADFDMQASSLGGVVDEQAYDHPNDLTTFINLNSALVTEPNGSTSPQGVQQIKDVAVLLPLGFLGDPLAAATCTSVQSVRERG